MKTDRYGKSGVIPGLVMLLFVATASQAQQAMTVEELEAYIEEQKAALAEVEANREKTVEEVEKLQADLAAEEEKRSSVEEEIDSLCKEQEEIREGSYDDCLKDFAS
jgi:peptidoglycan hydrolase CwlO-like protein